VLPCAELWCGKFRMCHLKIDRASYKCNEKGLIRYDLCELLSIIDYLLFYVPFKNVSLIWRHHCCQWRLQNLGLCLALWAGRDLYHATPAETHNLGFSSLIQMSAPYLSVTMCKGMLRTYSFKYEKLKYEYIAIKKTCCGNKSLY
jgi:hypothetical protein